VIFVKLPAVYITDTW